MRLAALGPGSDPSPTEQIDRALLAHLCRCTGWQTIEEAAAWSSAAIARSGRPASPRRDLDRAARRATLEGGVPQTVGAERRARPGRVRRRHRAGRRPGGRARRRGRLRGGRVAGRGPGPGRQGAGARAPAWPLDHPVARAPRALGPHPADHLGRAGLRGARRLVVRARAASRPRPSATAGPSAGSCTRRWPPTPAGWPTSNGRPVRVVWSREDVVRHGPKRPPVAAGINADGSGVLRVGVPLDGSPGDGWARAVADVASVAPGLVLEPVPLDGPADLLRPAGRGVGRGRRPGRLRPVAGARRRPGRSPDVPVEVTAPGGRPGRGPVPGRRLDRGGGGRRRGARRGGAALLLHRAPPTRPWAGCGPRASPWTPAGAVHDLTMRSFGILPARDMPPVTVVVGADGDRPAGQRLRRGVRRGGRGPLAGRRAPAPLAHRARAVPASPAPAGPSRVA